MDNFIELLKKYDLELSADRQFIINPRNNHKIIFYWDEIPTSILMIENFHPDVNGEKEILECLEEQIKNCLID
jgi:hypothetical protein